MLVTNSESVSSLGERGPGVSPSGMIPPYWEEMNFKARLTKFPKLEIVNDKRH